MVSRLLTRRSALTALSAAAVQTGLPSLSYASTGPSHRAVELTAVEQITSLGNVIEPITALTYEGYFDGKPLIAQQGETLKVSFSNHLAVPTSVHWHGLRVRQTMDGVARFGSPLVGPGESLDYEVPCKDPGLYWFHAHHQSLEQIAKGLFGALLVRSENQPHMPEQVLTLNDWPTAVSDKADDKLQVDWGRLKPSGEWSHNGIYGQLMTINNQADPKITAPASGCLRLRLLNVATARVFQPSILGARAFVIAFDGFDIDPQLLEQGVFLGPGQRMDILVSADADKPIDLALGNDLFGPGKTIRFDRSQAEGPKLKSVLSQHKTYEPTELVPGKSNKRFELALGAIVDDDYKAKNPMFWRLNGEPNLGDKPLFKAKVGDTIELDLINLSPFKHAMHFHGQHVRIISNDSAPWETGAYRDTISFPFFGTAKIAIRLMEPGRWPLHCHMLSHQASGMMTWYEVN